MTHATVRQERTGWRDEQISARHRLWGFNCPAVDLDFLVVEYNVGLPVAVIEYKHVGAPMPSFQHPTYRALSKLSDASQLPFLVVIYDNQEWWFQVRPVNAIAKRLYADGKVYSEQEFVTTLYKLRKQTIERSVLSKLNTTKPVGEMR